MAESAAPTARGATRRARTDERLTETVAGQLREQGYARLTIDRVASASGVAKTTIYRRWASKAEMVFDLVIHRTGEAPSIDTGALAGDVRALAERAIALIANDPGKDVLPGLLADMAGDAELATRLREAFVGAARDDITAILDRARGRGELAAEPDVEGFHAALLGIPYAHFHLLSDQDTTGLTRRLTDQLLHLLAA